MVRGLYTAATGMVSQQQKMDAISNNLANVNTTAYKREDLITESFDSVLTMKIQDVGSIGMRNTAIGRMSIGLGPSQSYTDFNQGVITNTGNQYNLAINGDGFMAVTIVDEEGNEREAFTRDGSLTKTPDGFLTTKSGAYIQGENGPIQLPPGEFVIDNQGKLYVDSMFIDSIRIVDIESKQNLEKLGSNLFAQVENGDQIDPNEIKEFQGLVMQGYLEGSNVNTVKEMVEMIKLSRTYQASQTIIKTYDSTLEKAVNSIGKV